jgi:acyl dehydratase
MSHVHSQLFEQPPSIALSILRALLYRRKGLQAHESLPLLSAQIVNVAINPRHLATYCSTCNIQPLPTLPILYPHVLAAPLHMWLITHPDFPLRLLGAVHLRNHIIQHRTIGLDEILNISCAITCERRTEKGLEFDFTTVVRCKNNDIIWEGLTTYFSRGRFGSADTESSLADLAKITDSKLIAEWFVPENLGKRYAVITQDYNPIHISKWLAKLFGFQRDLAHGFCVLATSLEKAQLSISTMATPIDTNKSRRLDVLFKGPMFLGAIAYLKTESAYLKTASDAQQNTRLDLYCGNNDRPSLCIDINDVQHNEHLPGII